MYQNMRVLVVDDTTIIRKLVVSTLQAMKITHTVEASDGLLAWEHLRGSEHPFHLIVSDWKMPNGHGLELLQRVRFDPRFMQIPFILITAESDALQNVAAIDAGVDGYLRKPFAPPDLQKKIQDVFKGQRTF